VPAVLQLSSPLLTIHEVGRRTKFERMRGSMLFINGPGVLKISGRHGNPQEP
jgi:hypothetical protein